MLMTYWLVLVVYKKEVYQQSKELMAKGGFNLRKWNSNLSVLLQHIKNEEGDVVQSKTEDRGGKSAN